MNPSEKRLLALWRGLDDANRETLFAFAEFLSSRSGKAEPETPTEPLPLPRPEKESVIGAIKRLSATYPMLDRGKMLHETSALMAQHVMQGRGAGEVIDELEIIFSRYYEKHRGGE